MGLKETDSLSDVSSNDETESGVDMSDEELGSFLRDAFSDYDPNLSDLADLCV